MQENNNPGLVLLGAFIFLGMAIMGYFLGNVAIEYKMYERSVTVKGLSEREYNADVVIWPIQFNVAGNELTDLYRTIDEQSVKIQKYLVDSGILPADITVSSPSITDKSAQQYGNDTQVKFRYTAFQTVTVYSKDVDVVRKVMSTLSQLGKQGIVLTGDSYQTQTEYLFTRLNEVKPAMIEEATTKAREVAEKFAKDSNSRLGKIKRATQGQFSIRARDKNNPHIKRVRVVSTIEYYLAD